MITPNLIWVNCKTNISLHSSFLLSLKASMKIFKINLTRHGDKSKVNNLNKSIALFEICSETIIDFINFSKSFNFWDIEGFITFLLPLYSSFIIFKCSSQHISVYLFLS